MEDLTTEPAMPRSINYLKDTHMLNVELNGTKIKVEIVMHDSGEEPEATGVNRMVSAKLGERTFHQVGSDAAAIKQLLRAVAAEAAFRHQPLPSLITVLLTSYTASFSIDWSGASSVLSKLIARGDIATLEAVLNS
jgi:hypothetical protein